MGLRLKEKLTLQEPRVGLITLRVSKGSLTPVNNLIDVLSSISNLVIFTGGAMNQDRTDLKNGVVMETIDTSEYENPVLKIFQFAKYQIVCGYKILKCRKQIDSWILFTGGERNLLSALMVKVIGGNLILGMPGSAVKDSNFSNSRYRTPTVIMSNIVLRLATKVVVYSKRMISEWGLERYESKVFVAREHFLDFEKFYKKNDLEERSKLIGYVGRLSGEKGVNNLVEALPQILTSHPDFSVVIIGDGEEKSKLIDKSKEHGLNNRVSFIGWVEHDYLPDYLNDFRLLILPSYTEGLPNIMLESMACGTPVLANNVGAISDVITHGETGFLSDGNSPEIIRDCVNKLLAREDLSLISISSEKLVRREFSLSNAAKMWREVL